MNKIQGTYSSGKTGSNLYKPWSGFTIDEEEYPLLNIGLSFTTSTKVSQFELHSFEVKGVKVHNPWKEKESGDIDEDKKQIDSIQKSSDNLRKRILNAEINENVDLEMVIDSRDKIASELYEQNNTTEITLCKNNEEIPVEEQVEVRYTGVAPENIDTVVQAIERGDLLPEIGGGAIPISTRDIAKETVEKIYGVPADLVVPSEPIANLLPTFRKRMLDTGEERYTLGGNKGWGAVCFLAGERGPILGAPVNQLLTNSANMFNGNLFDPILYNGREYVVYMRVRQLGLTTDTKVYYTEDYDELEGLFIDAIETDFKAKGTENYTKVWELMPMVETDNTPWEGKMSDWEGTDGRPDWNWVAIGTLEDAKDKFGEGKGVCGITNDDGSHTLSIDNQNPTPVATGQAPVTQTLPPAPDPEPLITDFSGTLEQYLAQFPTTGVPKDISDYDVGSSGDSAFIMTLEDARELKRVYGPLTFAAAGEENNPHRDYPEDPWYAYYEFRNINPSYIAIEVPSGAPGNIVDI